MTTTDGAIDQKLFYDLEWIYYCLLTKTFMQIQQNFIYHFKHKSNNIIDIQAQSIIRHYESHAHFVTNLNL